MPSESRHEAEVHAHRARHRLRRAALPRSTREHAAVSGAFQSRNRCECGLHGHDLLLKGFTVSQVVHDYGDICQTITELALESKAPIDTADFRTLNRCLDEAIAGAVTVYRRESEQSSLDGQTERGNQRMGFFPGKGCIFAVDLPRSPLPAATLF
jgi:hypothetical protein